MNINSLFVEEIQVITSDSRWVQLGILLEPKVGEIAALFYQELRSVPNLERLLSNNVVEKQLHLSLEGWLLSLLKKYDNESVFFLVSRQQAIGRIHAKINLDLSSFTYGIKVIKGAIFSYLEQQPNLARDDFYWMIHSLSNLIDILNCFISEAFFLHQTEYEQRENSLRIVGVIENVAVECERLRSLLFDWSRLTMMRLYEVPVSGGLHIVQLKDSDFGLWVIYKSEYLNQNADVPKNLWEAVLEIDVELGKLIDYRREANTDAFFSSLNVVSALVTKLSWFISTIADTSMNVEKSMDTLTRVLNRRYMNTILRRLTSISMSEGQVFSLLLIDIDDFKKVNDQFGHQSGDVILSGFAMQIMKNMKKSDFIFRYGGEEFLLVLSATGQDAALSIAHSICKECENHSYYIDHSANIKIKCSIGLSSHDGHPDYTRLLEQADQALYFAKAQGKNQARTYQELVSYKAQNSGLDIAN